MNPPDKIAGSVERITFHNEENGYSVVRIKPERRDMLPFKYSNDLITVVGNLPDLTVGEYVKLEGKWSNHARHGKQFVPEKCEQSMPATTEGIKRYLGSGMIRGVGKVMAERIVDRFGEETLDVIDDRPEELLSILGIGKKRILGIQKAWDEQRAIKDVMIFLQSHGVSTSLAVKIYKTYGDDSVQTVMQTPYKLVTDVHGIGFKTADKIARALGLAHDDPTRIEAGVAYTLNRMASEGHVYMPQADLEPEASTILGVETEKVHNVINNLVSSDFIKRDILTYETKEAETTTLQEEKAVYLTPFYFSEVGVTKRVRDLIGHPTSRLTQVRQALATKDAAYNLFDQLERKTGFKLASQQKSAVVTAVRNKLTVLTGGPGTGKTTTLRTLLDVLDLHHHTCLLASPTGRAAKRLKEATDREAKTIHRLLGFQPGRGFEHNEDNPLDADLIIIDEASMLDLMLFYSLLKAIGPDTHLLLVGDIDQLPSVGAGDVLNDLIESGQTAVIRLETIFRQSADSLIIHNAHRINEGKMPDIRPDATDFFMFIKDDPEEAADLLTDIVNRRAPAKFNLDRFDDIQVLSPMYNSAVGVRNLNLLLQKALNPAGKKAERRLGGRVLRTGDKVMQIVNNYEKSVYNGDIGRITDMDLLHQTMTVNIDGVPIVYDFLEADELVHAYAISVHKSQGSEYPCVVIPVMTQHYLMLQRNLIYTAITRAKKHVILVGTRKALRIAINNNKTMDRHTALDYRLTH